MVKGTHSNGHNNTRSMLRFLRHIDWLKFMGLGLIYALELGSF